jgi:hypothetical protein
MERSAVGVAALDEQVGEGAGCAELAELRPKAAFEDRSVEVEDALALDDDVGTYGVVAPAGSEAISVSAPSSASVSAILLWHS